MPAAVTAAAGLVLTVALNCDAVLDIAPPHLKIVSPADGDSVRGNALVRVEADDPNLLKLQLYLDDSLIATTAQSQLEVTADLDTSFSTHRLRAVAYDRGGNWCKDSTSVVRLVPRISLTLLSTLDTPGPAMDFAIAGAYLYVVGDSWLSILSLANPGLPVEMGRCTGRGGSDSYFCDVHVVGSLACVADYTGAPELFDVSDPRGPRLLSTLGIGSGSTGTYCAENTAYAVTRFDTFYVVDISNPSAPTVLGRCKIGALGSHLTCGHMEKAGTYMCVMNSWDGVEVVDVLNPAIPSRVAGLHHSNDNELGHLTIWRDTLYYANDGCVGIADISSPTSPVDIGEMKSRGDVTGVAVDSSLLYVTSWCHADPYPESLHILSRADGTELVKVPTTSAEPMSVAVADSFVYVACRDGYIQTYKRTQEWVAK